MYNTLTYSEQAFRKPFQEVKNFSSDFFVKYLGIATLYSDYYCHIMMTYKSWQEAKEEIFVNWEAWEQVISVIFIPNSEKYCNLT